MQSGKFKVAKWRSMLDQGSKEVGGRSDQIKAGNTSAKCHREVQSSKCDPPRSAKCDPKAIRWKAADTSARVQSAKCKGAAPLQQGSKVQGCKELPHQLPPCQSEKCLWYNSGTDLQSLLFFSKPFSPLLHTAK